MKEAEASLLSNARQIEGYKKLVENLQQQSTESKREKIKVVSQLQALYSVYNKQKSGVDRLNREKRGAEDERDVLKQHLETVEKSVARLKLELNRESDQKKDLINTHTVKLSSYHE